MSKICRVTGINTFYKTVVMVAVVAFLLGSNAFAQAKKTYDLVYFDGHMHTVESDGSGSLEDIKVAALNRGLDAVIVTNHTSMITLDEWKDMKKRVNSLSDKNFLMLNAFEVTGSEGMFNRDHVLAWGVADPFVGDNEDELAPEEVWESPRNEGGTGALYPENIAQWVDYIHEHGGIAVHAHTTGSTNPVYGVDFIEVFNLSHVKDVAFYATQMGYPADQAYGLGLTLNNMALYGERDLYMDVNFPGIGMIPLRDALYYATYDFSGVGEILGAPEAPLTSWDELLMAYMNGEMDHPTFGVANSDAHNTYNIEGHDVTGGSGDTYGDYSNDYSDVGEAKNGVFVKKLTPRHLLKAIRAGRCFATTGPSLQFTVNGRMMGETDLINTFKTEKCKLKLSIDSESETAVLTKIDIIKNGEIWKSITFNPSDQVFTFKETFIDDDCNFDGYYRVEVIALEMADDIPQPKFAWSNPVFIKIKNNLKNAARFATFNASLNRYNAGDLIEDLSTPDNSQAQAVAEIIQRTRPDVLLINEFDYDKGSLAALHFQDNYLSISQNGAKPIEYAHVFIAPSNTGIPSGRDLDKNGEIGGPGDAFGFGYFEGQYGMVVYSMFPIDHMSIRTFQNFLWKDMPGAMLPIDPATGEYWYDEGDLKVLRLSSKSHWDVPIKIGRKTVHFLVSHPTPPVFDGPEDRNGTRNNDEIRFWADYIKPGKQSKYIYDDKGVRGGLKPGEMFVIAGDQNADPFDGDSVPDSIQQLLDHPLVNTKVTPDSEGGPEQAELQGGANDDHFGDPAYDTADFADGSPGNLRVDFVLPRKNMRIIDAGVFWPTTDDPLFDLVGTYPYPSSDHRLVWINVKVPKAELYNKWIHN
ncbi:MAG: CehA/McbA family metallohydrolase [Desulfobacteraceae bacterium]|jgi:hypothetical protein